MSTFCGFDFGTSNTTIGVYYQNICQLIPLEDNKQSIRSAIFCDNEQKIWQFGQLGIDAYLEGVPGRLMMAIKSVLGSSLMDEETIIFGEPIRYTAILENFIKHIKTQAEIAIQQELTQVVLGRPVHFHDNDTNKDRLAEHTLEKIAKHVGFKEVYFQYEPIAAAIAYETTIRNEQLALIVDMGGGTSDFSIIRLSANRKNRNRSEDVLANEGIHIAGTDFDQRLSLHTVMPHLGMGSLVKGSSSDIEIPSTYYYDLTTWHTLHNFYSIKTKERLQAILVRAYQKTLVKRLLQVLVKRAGHHILYEVERCKQQLSNIEKSSLNLAFIEEDLLLEVLQADFNLMIDYEINQIIETILKTVSQARVKPNQINAIFFTGGSTQIPLIRNKITALFPKAAVACGDAFGSVGLGLTIDAKNKFAG